MPEPVDETNSVGWLTPGVKGIGGASLLADIGHVTSSTTDRWTIEHRPAASSIAAELRPSTAVERELICYETPPWRVG